MSAGSTAAPGLLLGAPLGTVAGLALHAGAAGPDGGRRLLLWLPADSLVEGPAGLARHSWRGAGRGQVLAPVAIAEHADGVLVAYPWVGDATVATLLEHASRRPGGLPELLVRLVLAQCLAALEALHDATGSAHGLLCPGLLILAGAPPERLIADCPRDPALRLAGAGVGAALSSAARRRAWVALAASGACPPELRGPRAARRPAGPAADLWMAGAVAAALLGGSPSRHRHGDGQLATLLAALLAPSPAARPAAGPAAAQARELALAGLASWVAGRPPLEGEVRYAAERPRRRWPGVVGERGPAEPGWGESAATARGAAQPVRTPRTRWWPGRGPGRISALVLGVGHAYAGVTDLRAAWVALAPSALAGLLSLLLVAVLLLGN